MSLPIRISVIGVAFVVLCLDTRYAEAGMPAPLQLFLEPEFKGRIQALSFFLLLLFLAPFPVKALWNWLRNDFTSMPRLTYGKALAMVLVWSAMFMLVLTMISGARELMTPGAWQRAPGEHLYKVNDG